MDRRQDRLRRRIQSIQFQIESLPKLRMLVMLPTHADITNRQWTVIEPQLVASSARLSSRLNRASEMLLARAGETGPARELNGALGQIEFDMTRAFTFFDTYMDVLTQRHAPQLGAMLAGCDVLRWKPYGATIRHSLSLSLRSSIASAESGRRSPGKVFRSPTDRRTRCRSSRSRTRASARNTI
jgi:hypothetical protein